MTRSLAGVRRSCYDHEVDTHSSLVAVGNFDADVAPGKYVLQLAACNLAEAGHQSTGRIR